MAPENEHSVCGECQWWLPYAGKSRLGSCVALVERSHWMDRPATRRDQECRVAPRGAVSGDNVI